MRQADIGHLAVAAILLIVVLLLGRLLRSRLRGWLERLTRSNSGPSGARLSLPTEPLAGAVAAAAGLLVLTIASEAYAWPPYAHLVFDLTIALGTFVLVRRLASTFGLAGSAGLAIAVVCGFVVLTSRYEQLGWVERSLDGVAVSLGATRISILDVLSAVFAGIVLYALVSAANRGARALIRRRPGLDLTQQLLAEKIAAVAIVVVAVFLAIDMLGVDTTALSVFSGTIGLGLGFGLQKIFSNLVSGIILLMDRSIKPGDVIVVAGVVGRVNRIGVRAVSVITRDSKEYLIPNELLMTERVENWSHSSRDVRIRMSVSVALDSDLDLVEQLLKEAALGSPRVLDAPAPVVWITELDDVGVRHELRFWIRDPEDGLGNIQGEMYRSILDRFREHKIGLPSPGREITIKKAPPISIGRIDEA